MRDKLRWAAVVFLVSARAAAVEQTDGTAIPVLPPLPERNLVSQSYGYSPTTSSYYDPDGTFIIEPIIYGEYYSPPDFPQFEDDDAITLQGLFKWRREALDWKADATSPRGAFVPTCPLTVEPVLQGGNCQSKLVWYNVADAASTVAPDESELYELIPANLASFLQCKDTTGFPKTDGFCPLGWDNRFPRDLSKYAWLPNHVTVDLAQDPRYEGGAIGFALVPDASSLYCHDTHYSVREHNNRNSAGQAYVGALVYRSEVDRGSVYLAFEDRTMLANEWTNAGMTDGDYNDYVAYVSGCFGGVMSGAGGEGAGGADTGSAGEASGGTTGSGGNGNGGNGNGGNAGEAGSMPDGEGGTPATENGGDSAITPDADAGSGGSAGKSSSSGDAGNADDQSSSKPNETSGCGCRVSSDSGPHSALLLALGLGVIARRRRRAR